MAALTSNYDTNEKNGLLIAYLPGTGKSIWQGGLVVVDNTTGLLEGASDSANKTFVGVAHEPGSTTTGIAPSGSTVRVRRSGVHIYTLSGNTAAQSLVGQKVYALDDNTVALTANSVNKVFVGTIVAPVGTTKVRIAIAQAVN